MTSSPATIRRKALLGLANRLFGAAVTAGLTLFLARALGPDEFGIFALGLGIASVLLLFSEVGVSLAAARYIAENRDDPDRVSEILASALRLNILFAGTVCGGLILLAGPIDSAYGDPGLEWVLRGMAIALFGQTIMGLAGGAFVALGRVGYDLQISAAESTTEAVATVGLVLISATAVNAAFGRAAGYAVGGLVAIVLAARMLGRRSVSPGAAHGLTLRKVAAYAGPLFVVDAAFVLFSQVDVLLIGAILSPAAAGLFQAPLRLITMLGYPVAALGDGVAPGLAARPGEERRVEPFRAALRFAILIQAAAIAPMVVWATPVIELALGTEYLESAEVLRALAPFVFLLGIGTIVSIAVNFLGEARRRIPIAIGSLVLNIAIDLVLIPEIGILGAAIGTDIAFLVYVAGHLWICDRDIGLNRRELLRTLLRAAAAAGAMAALLFAIGTKDLSVLELLAGSAGAVCVYVGALVALREVSASELRSLFER